MKNIKGGIFFSDDRAEKNFFCNGEGYTHTLSLMDF